MSDSFINLGDPLGDTDVVNIPKEVARGGLEETTVMFESGGR
jgi:hypothetical protein